MKKHKTKIFIFFPILVFLIIYFFINSIIEKNKFLKLKSLFTVEQKKLITKYIFPYRVIAYQEKIISELGDLDKMLYAELYFSKISAEISTTKNDILLSNNKLLQKHTLKRGFYSGINKFTPGSGYIDFFQDNIFILSSRGVIAFRNIYNGEENFKTIKNNINDFIDSEQFKKFNPNYNGKIKKINSRWFSLKDILIFQNKIFISYTEEIKENCWNTSIISGEINYENIEFKKLFSPKECIHSIKNLDGSFNAHASGGRIINFDDNHILLSIGEYLNRHLAQKENSLNGKILKINIDSAEYKIISMGHRNPQGLYFDKENNFILETEHGPMGGDEINIIDIKKINNDKIQNFGWAIASYGEHYGGKSKENEKKYKKYPLYKSHIDHGFIEPIKAFVPSIGISEIIKIKKNQYVVSSLKDNSLYFFGLNSEKKIINLERVEVFERVRDLKFKDNKLYLFMEDTASIGVINLN